MHKLNDLIELFDQCFLEHYNARLVEGYDEPIYLPAGCGYEPDNTSTNEPSKTIAAQPFAQVVLAHGYFASGLHEAAHWCLAGEKRRDQVDYGYWYSPDGRTAEQQRQFEQAEIKPQALEWAFTLACGREFTASCDNLSGDEFGRQPDRHSFQATIFAQLQSYIKNGFPPRAQLFINALRSFYSTAPVAKQIQRFQTEAFQRDSAA